MKVMEYRQDYIPEYRRPGWAPPRWVKFYPRDWRGDPEVDAMSLEERAVYFELIMLDGLRGYAGRIDGFAEVSTKFEQSFAEVLPKLCGNYAKTMAKDVRVGTRKFRRIFERISERFFVTSQGDIINRRSERERKRARIRRGFGAKMGRQSAPEKRPHPDIRDETSDDKRDVSLLKDDADANGRPGSADELADVCAWWEWICPHLLGGPGTPLAIPPLTTEEARGFAALFHSRPGLKAGVTTEAARVSEGARTKGFLTPSWLLRPGNIEKLMAGKYRAWQKAESRRAAGDGGW